MLTCSSAPLRPRLLALSLSLSLLACAACGKSAEETPDQGAPVDMAALPDAAPSPDDMDAADMAPADDMPAPDAAPDMPQQDMSEDMAQSAAITISGLSAPVDLRLDDYGVVYMSCQTDEDCFAAQGYIHAKHRLFAMDLIRRQTLGQLGAALGSLAIDIDKPFRHLMTTADGRKLEDVYFEALDDPTRSALEAYARGVNAFIADQRAKKPGATLSEEYRFPLLAKEIPDWRPQDSIAVYMQLAYQLGELSKVEIERTEQAALLGPEVTSDIFNVRPGTFSSVFGGSGEQGSPNMLGLSQRQAPRAAAQRWSGELEPARQALSEARDFMTRATSWTFGPKTEQQGSNNWVLSPSRTLNDKALLANDPHLALNNPSIWHFIVMDSATRGTGSLHVAGASIPAVPGIVIGHNGKVAWGTTTARLDMSDVYIETLNDDGTAVIFNGEEVPLITKEFTFEVYRGQPVTETFQWVPHHGPLISKDVQNKRGVSVKWVAHQGGEDLNFFVQLMKSQNVDEATAALQKIRALNQSWVLADASGKIAWYPHSYIPNRPWASLEQPTWMALPGDGSAEWEGFLTGDDTPHMIDPPAGLIVTANADFDGSYNDGDPYNDGHTVWQRVPMHGFRFDRIHTLLEQGGDAHTPESMLEIQADVYLDYAELILPALLPDLIDQRDALSPAGQAVYDTLSTWRYTCPTGLDGLDPMASGVDAAQANEAAGCAAFHVLLKNLATGIFGDELAALENFDTRFAWYDLQRGVLQIIVSPSNLIRGEQYFDDLATPDLEETRAMTLGRAFDQSGAELNMLFGDASAQSWLWGRIHTLSLESFFMQAGVASYNAGGQANDGGFETVDVAPPRYYGGAQDTYAQNHGASLRTVIELDTEQGFKTWFQLPGGQVHLRDDPRYLGLLERWLTNTPTTLPFGRDQIEQEITAEQLTISPAP